MFTFGSTFTVLFICIIWLHELYILFLVSNIKLSKFMITFHVLNMQSNNDLCTECSIRVKKKEISKLLLVGGCNCSFDFSSVNSLLKAKSWDIRIITVLPYEENISSILLMFSLFFTHVCFCSLRPKWAVPVENFLIPALFILIF